VLLIPALLEERGDVFGTVPTGARRRFAAVRSGLAPVGADDRLAACRSVCEQEEACRSRICAQGDLLGRPVQAA
jgi:hypothetical protein